MHGLSYIFFPFDEFFLNFSNLNGIIFSRLRDIYVQCRMHSSILRNHLKSIRREEGREPGNLQNTSFFDGINSRGGPFATLSLR